MTQTLSEIRSLLALRGIRPKHRLGQNFLHDHNILRILLDTAHAGGAFRAPEPSEPLVLEVGPGTGALTELLLDRGARVVACEIDRDMIDILRERVMPRAHGRLVIVEGDCLSGKQSLSPSLRRALGDAAAFTLVSNLPYASATPLIATLLAHHPECRGLFVTIQREVADRLMASPRSDAYGPLTVTASLLARVERVAEVAPRCFWPAPEVASAIVAIRPFAEADRPEVLRRPDQVLRFNRFVTAVFSRRRKQLGSVIGRETALPPGVRSTQRAEELSPTQWLELWRITSAKDADRPCE